MGRQVLGIQQRFKIKTAEGERSHQGIMAMLNELSNIKMKAMKRE